MSEEPGWDVRSTWLPDAPLSPDLSQLERWQPAQIVQRFGGSLDWASLGYVVIDELHEGVAGLVVSDWPRLDERGRLHFGEESASTRIGTLAEALLALLREERAPIVAVSMNAGEEEELRVRPVQIGDVFAARRLRRRARGDGGGGGGGRGIEDPRGWLTGPILDITAEAVEVAKAQANAALSGAADETFLAIIAEEMNDDEGGPPTTSTPPPVPTPSSSGGSGAAIANEQERQKHVAQAAAAEAASVHDDIATEAERLHHELDIAQEGEDAWETEEQREQSSEGTAEA